MSGKFIIHNETTYLGPNLELDQQAVILELQSVGTIDTALLWKHLTQEYPELAAEKEPSSFAELFARAVIKVQQLGMDLFATKWNTRSNGAVDVIAVQFIDPKTCQRTIDLVHDWFRDILLNRQFPFKTRLKEIELLFQKSHFGGPTIYSIIEAGYRRNLPMFYIKSEDVFQWGQGRKQLRGRSTVLHRDSIKDTELTSNKDLAKEFLEDLGFPVPPGRLCSSVSEAQRIAPELGFPVVTKPIDGHKGQGVTTNIMSADEVRLGFEIAREASKVKSDPIIIEKHVTGTDHRLLTISGKFIAALQRIPAYVIGDGKLTIEELITLENERPERADTPRSALGKIKIDEILVDFIHDHGWSLSDVPPAGTTVVLRRVANISAGGVSVNVTDKIHPLNKKLAEDVARFLDVHVLGIDLLAEDISKPWTESPCAIIEINAGPGVFMHLVPAQGESINVPDKILEAFFPTFDSARVPTLVFNKLPATFAKLVTESCLKNPLVEEVGVAKQDGVFFNNEFFSNRSDYISNIRNVMRNPHLDVALLEYSEEIIQSKGLYHWKADIVVLDNPTQVERVLTRDILPHSIVLEIDRHAQNLRVTSPDSQKMIPFTPDQLEPLILETINPLLHELIQRYYVKL